MQEFYAKEFGVDVMSNIRVGSMLKTKTPSYSSILRMLISQFIHDMRKFFK